jgi:hypothetical protein
VKLFIAWSGAASQQLASFMHEWLKSIVQAIDPFMSSKDIRQGQRWASEIGGKLAEVDFALLCLTPTNLENRWIHFEAGAVSKNIEKARVSALLFDVTTPQIEFPLQQFQHTALTREGLWKLVQDINKLCPTPLQDPVLKRAFDRAFPEVETELASIRKTLAQEQKRNGDGTPKRTTDDVLADLLATQQGLAAKMDSIEQNVRRVRHAVGHGEHHVFPRTIERLSASRVAEEEILEYIKASGGEFNEVGLSKLLNRIESRFGARVKAEGHALAMALGSASTDSKEKK